MTFKQSRTAVAVAALCLAGLFTSAAAASPVTHPAADDPVVARIGDTEVRRSDLIIAQQLLPASYRKMPIDAIYPLLLKQLINSTLVVRAARGEGLDRTEAVRRRLEAIERRLVEGAYLARAAKGKVTNEALRARYRAVTEARRGNEEIRVRHILVQSKSAAAAVIEELAGGADFAALARRASIGPSKARGGDLGYLAREAMARPFAAAAFGLAVGAVTPTPIETRFGWHVIKLEDRRAARIPSFEELRPRLARQIRARIADEVVMKLRREVTIEEFDINGKPKPISASRSMPRGNR